MAGESGYRLGRRLARTVAVVVASAVVVLLLAAHVPLGHTTAMHLVAKAGWTRAAKVLLGLGANPNATDGKGRTPLHYAVWRQHEDIVATLLARGAAAGRADKNGFTPSTSPRT